MKEKTRKDAASEKPEMVTTAVHIPKDLWQVLRAVAFTRSQKQGGRASVSRLVTEILEEHEDELRKEMEGYYKKQMSGSAE